MKIEAFIAPTETGTYRASNATFGIILEAPTREDVISQFREWIQVHWNRGGEVLAFEVPPGDHPLKKFAGIMRGDPIVGEWKQAIAEYRQLVDEGTDQP